MCIYGTKELLMGRKMVLYYGTLLRKINSCFTSLNVLLRPGADSDTDAAEVAIYTNPGGAFNNCPATGEGIIEVRAFNIHIPGFPGSGMGRT